MKQIPLDSLEEGAVLDAPLYSEDKQLLLKEGVEITSSHIRNLSDRGIEFVQTASEQFEDEDAEPEPEEISPLEQLTESHAENRERAEVETAVSQEVVKELRELLSEVFESKGEKLAEGELEELVAETTQDLLSKSHFRDTMLLLGDYSEFRLDHSINVMTLLVAQQSRRGVVDPEMAIGSLLHDIGAPLEPLQDGRVLESGDEVEAMNDDSIRGYPKRSADLLTDVIELPGEVVEMIEDHRERFNGEGYPAGKDSNNLSPLALRLGISDSFDLMVYQRVKRGVVGFSSAMSELVDQGEERFGSRVLNDFVKLVGFYPVGTMVKLSNGYFGMVKELNETHRTRPVVSLLYDETLSPLDPPREMDLAEQRNLQIVESM